MKKMLILAAALLVLAGTCASAQGRWGLQGGLTFSTIKFEKNSSVEEKYNTRTGWLMGLTYDADLLSSVGIQTGLTFVQRNVEHNAQAQSTTFKTASLELPLNVKVTLPVPVVNPYLLAGPYLDFSLDPRKRFDDQVKFNRFNYGIALGAGVNILGTLRVIYQYDLGLSKLGTSTSDAIFNSDAKNRSHRLSVGVMF